MKKTKEIIYYGCPVCGKNSSNRKEMQKHFASHTLNIDEVVYCNICGAGWHVSHYGRTRAHLLAEQCHQKHIDEGNADDMAARSYFLTGGSVGYVKVKEGKNEKETE